VTVKKESRLERMESELLSLKVHLATPQSLWRDLGCGKETMV
jgi:hypothetical protein